MTRASDARPTRRVVTGSDSRSEFVVVVGDRFIGIRPKGSRVDGRAHITVTPAGLYFMLFEARYHKELERKAAAKKRSRKVRRAR